MKKALFLTLLLTLSAFSMGFAQLRVILNPTPAASGSIVTVPVQIQNISNCGAFTAFFHYNSAGLSYAGIDTVGTLLSGTGVSVVDSNNTIRIAYFDFTPTLNSSSGTLIKIRFNFNGTPSALIWNTERTEFSIGSTATKPIMENGRVFNAASTVNFTAQCQNASVCELATAQYSITASNATSYQWQISNDSIGNGFSNIVGATSATYNRTNVAINDDRKYLQCVVSDGSASSLSGLARLFVNPNNFVQVVVSSSTTGAVCSGTSITYSLNTTPSVSNPIYSWTVNGQSVGTSSTYTSTAISHGDVIGCSVTSSTECVAANVNSTTSVTASINPLPTIYSVSGGGDRCDGSATTRNITLSGSQSGTTYTLSLGGSTVASLAGTGSALTFNGLTNAGIYTVSALSATNCSNSMSGSATIVVNPLPSFSLSAVGGSTTISSGGAAQLQATNLSNVSYSWSPSSGMVGPSTRNPVVYPTSTTTYVCTVSNLITGCSTSDSITITVQPAPTVDAGTDFSVCASGSPITLSGTPAGGSWSGTGISGSTFTPPSSAGSYNLTYTVIQLGVSYSDIVVATVNARPNVTLLAFSAVCTGSPTITLSGGSPSGGNYTVNGTSATTFNPISSGNYTIVYSYSDANGCSNTASRSLTVNQTTAVTITSSRDSINAGGSVSLTATELPLGTYSWTPSSTLSATNTRIVVATPIATTTYSVTGTNISGCPSTASKTIIVLSLPSVNAGNDTTLCHNSGSLNLVGSPAGGTWSGTGVSGNSFNPNSVGTFTITYTYAQLGSNFTDTRVITVAANPSVSLSAFSAQCEGDPSFVLSGGSPSGGSYTVNGNSSNNFNPSTAGTFTVVYSFTNGSGCTATATGTITVNAKTTVIWNPLGALSIIDPVLSLNGSATPVGGVYSGTGVSLNGSTYEFDPSSAGAGTFTLTYTYVNGNGCTTVATNSITVTVPEYNIWSGNGSWTSAGNWTLGVPSSGQNVRISSGTVNVNTNATVNKMQVLSGATINIGSSSHTGTSYSITVNDSLVNSGGINVLNPVSASSSINENHLVQGTGSILTGSGSSNFTKWTGNTNDTIYNYHSSPVSGFTIGGLGATDTRNHYTYNASTGWVRPGLSDIMTPGIGYSSTGTTAGRIVYSANGSNRFNNGNITAAVSGDTTPGRNGWNLVGNPYPSSISAASFLVENPGLYQAVWFWSQRIASTWPFGTLNGDYASWNLTGGIAGSQGGAIPNGQISAGQGIFIKIPTANYTLNAVSFNNGQRTNSNATVFRTQFMEKAWIDLTGPNNAFNQTLIAFSQATSQGFDSQFDAEKQKGNDRIALYSMLNNVDMGIQALAERSSTLERVSLGLDAAVNGTYQFALAQSEGFPVGTVISIKDFATGILHNLTTAPYNFSISQSGAIRNRFEVQFNGQISSTSNPTISPLYVFITNQRLQIGGLDENEKIKQIEIVDITGKIVYSRRMEGDSAYQPMELNYNQGVYFARIATNRQQIIRKFMLNQ